MSSAIENIRMAAVAMAGTAHRASNIPLQILQICLHRAAMVL